MTRKPNRTRGTPLLAAVLAAAAAHADCNTGGAAEATQAEQKMRLLQRLTSDSAPLRKLRESGNEAALATLDNALAIMASAEEAMANGCQGDAAALSNEALRLVTEAFRTGSASGQAARDEFAAEVGRTRSFLAAFEGRSAEDTGLDAEAIAGIRRQISNAESLAKSGDVAEARELLLPVNDRLQRRLLQIYDQRTIYYEQAFATPADEYVYLEQQYDGYMLLLQSGNKETPYSARQRVSSMIENAERLREEARSHAAANELDAALTAINGALEYCEHAVRATGYAF